MKKNGVAIFLGIILLICGVSYVAFNGVGSGTFGVDSIADSMKLGLDIEGGVVVVYEAETNATGEELLQLMNQTKSVIVKRIDSMGLTEPNITVQGDKRVRIELPGVKNANDALELIGKTAQLEFVLVDVDSIAMSGMTKDDFKGSLILTGQEVKDSNLSFKTPSSK